MIKKHSNDSTNNKKIKTIILSLRLLQLIQPVQCIYESSQLFPNNDEYELSKLNPETMYGSPYGGFSRASASRLAKFPLLLRSGFDDDNDDANDNGSDDSKNDNDNDNRYFQLNDSNGRNFVCKGYNKEDISQDDSLTSMFDEVDEVMVGYYNGNNYDNKNNELNDIEQLHIGDADAVNNVEEEMFDPMVWNSNPQQLLLLMNALYNDKHLYDYLDADEENELKDNINTVVDHVSIKPQKTMSQTILKDFHNTLNSYLKKQLLNICTQKHDGWWSYNYCYQKGIGQFHIEAKLAQNTDTASSGNQEQQLKASIDTMIRIGTFDKHKYVFSDDFHFLTIKETFDDGDMCDIIDSDDKKISKPRNAIVHLTCCREPTSTNKKTTTGPAGIRLNQLFISNIQEIEPCSYKLNVCSKSLCSQYWNIELLDSLSKPEYKSKLYRLWKDIIINKSSSNDNNEHSSSAISDFNSQSNNNSKHSIREILQRVLVGRCLTRNEGWWTYEFCHGKHVRQFHSQTIVDSTTSKHRTVIETQHNLGYYESPNPFKSDVDFIFNSTILSRGRERDVNHPIDNNDADHNNIDGYAKPIINPGNVYKYYEMEYKRGDTCAHTDEDESTLTNSFPEGIDRATSVRFSCGEKYELLNINEDSTCHYIMEITVPDLCNHPSFHVEVKEEPVYVVKCLH